jgi:hypothetical protein
MRHVERGGSYLRVADPGWEDPLSGEYVRDTGGRWNPPGAFEVVYLNADLRVARAQVRHKLEPIGVGPEDLDPDRGPALIRTSIPRQPYVDAVSDRGLSSLGLPTSYPLDDRGKPVPHRACQPIGEKAWDRGEPGIACRSLASSPVAGEELAYFNHGKKLKAESKEKFSEWFWR